MLKAAMNKHAKQIIKPLATRVLRIFSDPINRIPKRKIAMLHLGRCGSTVLGNLLSQHAALYWGEEIYSSIFMPRKWASRKAPVTKDDAE